MGTIHWSLLTRGRNRLHSMELYFLLFVSFSSDCGNVFLHHMFNFLFFFKITKWGLWVLWNCFRLLLTFFMIIVLLFQRFVSQSFQHGNLLVKALTLHIHLIVLFAGDFTAMWCNFLMNVLAMVDKLNIYAVLHFFLCGKVLCINAIPKFLVQVKGYLIRSNAVLHVFRILRRC